MLIQYLLTTVKKEKDDIKTILDSANICGNILVGNQLMAEESEYDILTEKYTAKVFNLKSKGVSRNRNFLLLNSTAQYVTFLDDDMYFDSNKQFFAEKIIANSTYNAIRFNVVSDNLARPIKTINKNGFVNFRKLSSNGVWGIFYKREFLLKNKLFFREEIGPGTNINHGEDGIFNKDFLKHSKIYCFSEIVFHVKQIESTWQGENRNLKQELFSHGYVYQLLYPKFSKLMARLFIYTHMQCFPKGTTKSFLFKNMCDGIDAAKNLNKRKI